MTAPLPPLLDLFDALRAHGVPLGVDSFILLQEALQGGFGLQDRTALRNVCHALWIKNNSDSALFNRLFDLHVPAALLTTITPDAPRMPAPPLPRAAPLDTPPPPTPRAVAASPAIHDPTRAADAQRRAPPPPDALALPRTRATVLTEYFPVTTRQMKQSWRYLRRPARVGPPVELDIDATVERIGRVGLIAEPVLRPRRVNTARLVLLVDRAEPMTPFYELAAQLVETAQRDGRLAVVGVFYFARYPDEYLHTDPGRTDALPFSKLLLSLNAQSTTGADARAATGTPDIPDDSALARAAQADSQRTLERLLAQLDPRTAVLIISDAGVALGQPDPARAARTHAFITRVRRATRYCAWLNPFPPARWPGTPASTLAPHVPMFELSAQGLSAALYALRGRHPRPAPAQTPPARIPLTPGPHDRGTQRLRAFERRLATHTPAERARARLLACHAAFPLALTPDLLYRIWSAFVPDAPWTAVADILLSPLCRLIGPSLYELDEEAGTRLRAELTNLPDGTQRVAELSTFINDLAAAQLSDPDPDERRLAAGQRWAILARTHPAEAAHRFATTLATDLNAAAPADELLHLASLTTALLPSTTDYAAVRTYAQGAAQAARGETDAARATLATIADQQAFGVALTVPADLRAAEPAADEPADAKGPPRKRPTRKGAATKGPARKATPRRPTLSLTTWRAKLAAPLKTWFTDWQASACPSPFAFLAWLSLAPLTELWLKDAEQAQAALDAVLPPSSAGSATQAQAAPEAALPPESASPAAPTEAQPAFGQSADAPDLPSTSALKTFLSEYYAELQYASDPSVRAFNTRLDNLPDAITVLTDLDRLLTTLNVHIRANKALAKLSGDTAGFSQRPARGVAFDALDHAYGNYTEALRARQRFAESFFYARLIPSPTIRAANLVELAKACVAANDPLAEAVLNEAAKTTAQVSNPETRDDLLNELAALHAELPSAAFTLDTWRTAAAARVAAWIAAWQPTDSSFDASTDQSHNLYGVLAATALMPLAEATTRNANATGVLAQIWEGRSAIALLTADVSDAYQLADNLAIARLSGTVLSKADQVDFTAEQVQTELRVVLDRLDLHEPLYAAFGQVVDREDRFNVGAIVGMSCLKMRHFTLARPCLDASFNAIHAFDSGPKRDARLAFLIHAITKTIPRNAPPSESFTPTDTSSDEVALLDRALTECEVIADSGTRAECFTMLAETLRTHDPERSYAALTRATAAAQAIHKLAAREAALQKLRDFTDAATPYTEE